MWMYLILEHSLFRFPETSNLLSLYQKNLPAFIKHQVADTSLVTLYEIGFLKLELTFVD